MFDLLTPARRDAGERPLDRAEIPGRGGPRRDGAAIEAFLRSVGPALETAFSPDRGGALPRDIAGLVGQLHAGPLGRRAPRHRAALRLAQARRRRRTGRDE
ncbi:hypothetical protein [Methylobacterium planeticum]|uniref:Uncharacterized protein n=1 Tax=Methylobacterium planeticum TaxID=2615211 RepID=A0A6N6MU94_9HYPH|nr:hypothetical protein [Methylobacterium planeticum]KAB1074085.1 hypothetical protein F6X51_10235 [Methylobacterium planeticum]